MKITAFADRYSISLLNKDASESNIDPKQRKRFTQWLLKTRGRPSMRDLLPSGWPDIVGYLCLLDFVERQVPASRTPSFPDALERAILAAKAACSDFGYLAESGPYTTFTRLTSQSSTTGAAIIYFIQLHFENTFCVTPVMLVVSTSKFANQAALSVTSILSTARRLLWLS